VLLTAAYNEEAHIEETIRSIVRQLVRPHTWVIVSDGSTDRTDEIVRQYAASHTFIHFVRREKDQSRRFASKVFALGAGLQALAGKPAEFIGHLDADLSPEPGYFRDLLKHFRDDPTLGIAGGWYFEKSGNELRPAPGSTSRSVPGGVQMFRYECYRDIRGLLPIEYGGEDWYAEIMARKCGWRVRSFPSLKVYHRRETGTAGSKLRYCYRQGFMAFALGSHPLFELAAGAKRALWRPYGVGAFTRLAGFLMAHISGRRMVPPEFVTFLREEQIGRLLPNPFAIAKGQPQRSCMSAVRVCAITCDCYPDDPLVRRTAEAAAVAGFEYHVICSMNEGQSEYEVFHGVHVHRIFIRGPKGKSLGRITARGLPAMLVLWSRFALSALLKVARLHFLWRFAVVHVHNMPDFLVFAAVIPRLLGSQVILHVQDVSPELMAVKVNGIARKITFLLARWQERVSTAFANHVLTVGWPFEKLLLQRGVPGEKLSSVLNSADPSIFPKEKRTGPFLGKATAQRPLILMYHGTCSKRNGLDTAIRAFARARAMAPHLRLHLRGEGDSLSRLKQLAETLGVADGVSFFPHGSLDTVADFVAQGDIGIIPYPADGFMDLVLPTKAYEFALMRRPMIASDTPATRSLFRADSIRFCEPSNVEHFAQAIVELYHHPEKRAYLVASAEQDYRKHRWEVMAERYCQLLSSLAGESAGSRPVAVSRPAA
jgi:glycosyltransferase involved in cell wall biosynthesis